MKHSPHEYDEIDEAALQIRLDYGFTDLSLDIFKLANCLGMTVTPYSELSKEQWRIINSNITLEDGFTIQRNENGVIKYYTFYNDSVSHSRQRFTIAHEIKHVVFNESEPDEKQEDMADHFARYILAPTCLVMKFACDSPFNIASMFDISFEASENAYKAATHRIEYNRADLSETEEEFMSKFKKK